MAAGEQFLPDRLSEELVDDNDVQIILRLLKMEITVPVNEF